VTEKNMVRLHRWPYYRSLSDPATHKEC